MYSLIIAGYPTKITLPFAEAYAWREVVQKKNPQEEIEIVIADRDGNEVIACLMCEAPTPATHLVGDWPVCEAHAAGLEDAGPRCEACGGPLSEDDVLAGEVTCLDCAAAEVTIDLETPLLAVVRARLTAEFPQSDSSSTSSTARRSGRKPAGRGRGGARRGVEEEEKGGSLFNLKS